MVQNLAAAALWNCNALWTYWLSSHFDGDLENKGCKSWATRFQNDVTSHFYTDVFTAGEPDADVVIFRFHNTKAVFQLQEWNEKRLLPIFLDTNTCIDDHSL